MRVDVEHVTEVVENLAKHGLSVLGRGLAQDVLTHDGPRLIGMRGHQDDLGGLLGLALVAQRLDGWDPGSEEGEPELELLLLVLGGVLQAEDDNVEAVDVADEVVVHEVVVLVAGKLPDAEFATGAQGAL